MLVSAPDELKSNPGQLIAIVQHPTKSSKVLLVLVVFSVLAFNC